MTAEDIEDLFRPVCRVTLRRMFGGHGIYRDDRMIAIEADGQIWLKADVITKDAFRMAGSSPFTYSRNGTSFAMSYWLLPDRCFEDVDWLRHWTGLATDAAHRTSQSRGKKGKSSKDLPL